MAIIGISKISVLGSNPSVPAKFMQPILGFFTGTSIGYFSGNFFGGSQVGQTGLVGPLLLHLGDLQIHLHHCLISGILLLFIFPFLNKKYKFSPIFSAFTIGFLGGMIFQGIFSYNDWHQILIQ